MHEIKEAIVKTIKDIDDIGYEKFIRDVGSRIAESASAKGEPHHGRIERGYVKRLSGVVSDTHVTIIWDGDLIAGIGISSRDDMNRTQIVTVDLGPTNGGDGNPLDPDTQGEIYSAEVVKDAAYGWMEKGGKKQ